jgi:hypothetical protein
MGFFDKRYEAKVYEWDLPKRTDRSIYLGKVAESTADVYMDVDQLCKHTIIAGITGGGKTVAGNVIIEDALRHNASVLIIDPTTQWAGIIKENNDEAHKLRYDRFKMRYADRTGLPTRILYLENNTSFAQATDLTTILQPGIPTVVLVHKLSPKELDRYVCELIKAIRDARLPQSKQLRLLVLFDEVHCILPKFGGTGTGFVELERGAREFREFGVGLLLLSQVLEDFLGSIRANINTEIQMRTTFDDDLDKARIKYGEAIAHSIMKAQTGTGLFHNADYNQGSPFFVTFRPPLHSTDQLPENELQEYLTIAERIRVVDSMHKKDPPLFLDQARKALYAGKLRTATHLLDSLDEEGKEKSTRGD